MANSLSKDANLKFNKNYFEEEDTPHLIINLWAYNYYPNHQPCTACEIYSSFCKKVLKKRWDADWGDFDLVMGKIKKCDQNFININNYSSMTKWSILDKLIQITTPFDLKATLIQLLKQIWNFNTHSDKYECVGCLAFEEWCIDFAKTKWEPNFIDFDFTIQKIRETDRTFINFERISIFEPEKFFVPLRTK